MKRLSKKALCLAAAGLVLAGGASVGSAYAYFTTYTEVSGGAVFNLGQTKTEIDERVENGTKIDGGSRKWSNGGDGYWYYSDLVQPGETTGTLNIKIPQELLGDVTEDTELNVIVVQECAPESYDENGALLPNGPARFQKTAGN